MANRNYTNLDLLKSIKLGCMVPVSQIALSDEDILFLASEEQELDVLSKVLSVREEYNVYVEQYDFTNGNGENSKYKIPSRASGGKLRSVFLKDSNNTLYKCAEISIDEVPMVQSNYVNNVWCPMFYLQNDQVVFLSNQFQTNSAQYVELHYYMEPNSLVLPERCLKIKSINTTTGLIIVDERQIPEHFEIGTQIDFIQAIPSNKLKKIDISVVSVSSNNPVSGQKFITVAAASLPDDLVVGDYIALAGETPVPQLVSNLRPLLAQCTICRILQSQGDNENIVVALKARDKMEKGLLTLTQDRTEGNPKKIVNRSGVMRSSLIGTGGRRRGG